MIRSAVLAALLAACSSAALAQQAARNLAAPCAICHGTQGKPAPDAPLIPLAGLPQDHIATQMRAFRDGKRPATVMHQIAKGYTDAQIDALAAWFAAQKR
ncbi:MAG TPA: c-type cytochrome [Burkholderiales bacterium]|nr:c-type cytochrome [Burkholderiales bacterium]